MTKLLKFTKIIYIVGCFFIYNLFIFLNMFNLFVFKVFQKNKIFEFYFNF